MTSRVNSEDFSVNDVRRAAMDLLGRREHSSREMERKLCSRFLEDLVEEALERLKSEGLQRDERFIESYIHSRQQKGYGSVRIKAELFQKGLEIDLIAGYLFEEDEIWQEIALRLKSRKFGDSPPDGAKAREKQFRYLAQKGFSSRQINDCLSVAN